MVENLFKIDVITAQDASKAALDNVDNINYVLNFIYDEIRDHSASGSRFKMISTDCFSLRDEYADWINIVDHLVSNGFLAKVVGLELDALYPLSFTGMKNRENIELVKYLVIRW